MSRLSSAPMRSSLIGSSGMSADAVLTSDLAVATSCAMSRLRGIVVCLLSLVLVTAQVATAVQASAMALEMPATAVETPMAMADDGMSGDCDDCGTNEAESGLCPVNCCASCSTTAAVVPSEAMDGVAIGNVRSLLSSRLLIGLAPSPHLTPPKHLVLS